MLEGRIMDAKDDLDTELVEERKSPPLHVDNCALDGTKVGTYFDDVFNVIDVLDAFDGGVGLTTLGLVNFELTLTQGIRITETSGANEGIVVLWGKMEDFDVSGLIQCAVQFSVLKAGKEDAGGKFLIKWVIDMCECRGFS